jgi:hypothetical protein
MVTVGAQQNGNVVGENATALSRLNEGYADRVITDKSSIIDTSTSNASGSKSPIDIYKENLAVYALVNNKINDGTITYDDISNNKQAIADILSFELGYFTQQGNIAGQGFIPLSLQLTVDGLSGLRLLESYEINTELLPPNYRNNIKFIIKGITHKIDNSGWYTTIESFSGPKKDTLAPVTNFNFFVKPAPNLSGTGGTGGETGTSGNLLVGSATVTNGAYSIRNQGAIKTEYWKMGVHHSYTTKGKINTPGGEWSVGFKRSGFVSYFAGASGYETILSNNTNLKYPVFDFTLLRNGSSDVDIPAPFDGTVVAQGHDRSGNAYMALLGTDGIKTAMILHMKTFYKKKGDTFVKGEKLAVQGNVVPGTGTHTHAELISLEDFANWWNLILSLPEDYDGLP